MTNGQNVRGGGFERNGDVSPAMKPKVPSLRVGGTLTQNRRGTLVPAIGSLLGHEEAEKAMRLVAYPGSEKQPVARSGGMVVAKP